MAMAGVATEVAVGGVWVRTSLSDSTWSNGVNKAAVWLQVEFIHKLVVTKYWHDIQNGTD